MPERKVLSWDKIEDYLKSIGMIADIDIQRTKEIFSQGQFLCPEELKAIFISNYKETNGKEQFKDLWLFSDSCVIEVLNFCRQETFALEITKFTNSINFVRIEPKNFDFSQTANDDSRLQVKFNLRNDYVCDQISSGLNCDVLKSIYLEYVVPNLAT